MLELMKKQTTPSLTELCLRVPTKDADGIGNAITHFLLLAGHAVRFGPDEDDALYPAKDVFPDPSPGKKLRGLRVREDLTQAQLAEQLGLCQNHISEMETGKRAISVDMAKRIEACFHVPYKVFL